MAIPGVVVVVNSSRPRETEFGSALAQNQIPIAPQNSHVVSVLVKGMLPPALSNDAHQTPARPDACEDSRYTAGADIPPHSLRSMSSGIERPLMRKYAG